MVMPCLLFVGEADGRRAAVEKCARQISHAWYCEQPCREMVDLSKSDAEIMQWTEKLARSLPGFQSRETWSAGLRRKMQAP
jgi:hypothetical protein